MFRWSYILAIAAALTSSNVFAEQVQRAEVERLYQPMEKVRSTYQSIEYSATVEEEIRSIMRPTTLPARSWRDLVIFRLDAPEIAAWKYRHGARDNRSYFVVEPIQIPPRLAGSRGYSQEVTYRRDAANTLVFKPSQNQVLRGPAEGPDAMEPRIQEKGIIADLIGDYYGTDAFERFCGLPPEEWAAAQAAREITSSLTKTGSLRTLRYVGKSDVRDLTRELVIEFDETQGSLPTRISAFRDGRPFQTVEYSWHEQPSDRWLVKRATITRYESSWVDGSRPGAVSDITTTTVDLGSVRDDEAAFAATFDGLIPPTGVVVTDVSRPVDANQRVRPAPSTEVTRTMQWMVLAAVLATLLTIAILAIVLGKRKAKTGS